MSDHPKVKLELPETWMKFEDLCWGLWKVIWKDDGAKKYGRNGQAQNGVDIYGRPDKDTKWAGVQCKGKDIYNNQKLTIEEIQEEATKARDFTPKLSEYTIATTAPRDKNLQNYANNLTSENMHKGWFSVDVCGWDDIVDLLWEHKPPIAADHYPRVFGGEMIRLAKDLLKCVPSVIRNTQPEKSQTSFPMMKESNITSNKLHIARSGVMDTQLSLNDESDIVDNPKNVQLVIELLHEKLMEKNTIRCEKDVLLYNETHMFSFNE